MRIIRSLFPMLFVFAAGCASALDDASVEPASARGATSASSEASGCVVSGEGRTIAPNALLRPGIQLVSSTDSLALGFSPAPHEAVTLRLDPSSAAPLEAHPRRSVDGECRSTHLQSPAHIAAKEPFAIGTSGGAVAWTSCATDEPHALWAFEAGAIQELRGIGLADGGFSLVFRAGETIWFGRLDAEKNPVGPLARIASRPHLRSPALAQSGDGLLVVWSELREAAEHWTLAAASVAPCGHATPIDLALPSDEVAGDAIQPSLAPVDGGSFLLVWTQGPAWSHQVRAATIEAHGHAVGRTLQVSSGAESGWGRPALTADGRGAVVYLVPTDRGFALAATPIVCPAPRVTAVTRL